jgi:hypothetical protein
MRYEMRRRSGESAVVSRVDSSWLVAYPMVLLPGLAFMGRWFMRAII